MPYELEYKKVHNTLSGKVNKNHYGYEEGDRVTFISNGRIDFSTAVQFVIQNNKNTSNAFSIQFFDKEGNILDHVVNLPNSYSWSNRQAFYTLAVGENLLVKIPASKEFFNEEEDALMTPVYAIVTSSDCSLWYTEDVIGKEEKGIIVEEIEIDPTQTFFTWKESPLLENLKTAINKASLSYANRTITITLDPNYTFTDNQLAALELSVVLIPFKYYSNNNRKESLRDKIHILKNITNTRNNRQSSLYPSSAPLSPVTAYAEPIILHFSNNVASRHFADPSANSNYPLNTKMRVVSTRRNNDSYALIDNVNEDSYLLCLCSGCGYDDGGEGGYTYIKFGLGLQKVKDENPHSGCSLTYSNIPRDEQPITLVRRPLASTNGNPVILINE